MPEPAVAPPPAAGAAPGSDPKGPAAGISRGIQDRANGKPTTPAQTQPGRDAIQREDKANADKAAAAAKPADQDPNAGKKRYVVEGKEYWLTPEQADSYVSKGIGFEPKVSEIARIRQEMNELHRALLSNPGAVLMNVAKRNNVPISQVVQNVLQGTASDEVKEATGRWYYENVAKRQQMDPKDLQILEQDEKLRAFEDEKKKTYQQAVMQENIQRVTSNMNQLRSQIGETLGELGIKNVDTPIAARLVKEIADVMRISYFSRQPCTAKQAADKIRQRVLDFQTQFYDELEPAALIERLGQKNVEKIRAHLLKTVQDAESGTRQNGENRPFKPKVRNERETITPDQMKDYLDDLKRTNALPGK